MFVLGHFFLLGMDHGPDMKWAEVPISFGPTLFLVALKFYNNKKKVLYVFYAKKKKKERRRS